MKSDKVIAWWSGGITSAVACKIAIDLFGKENCRVIMIDTKNGFCGVNDLSERKITEGQINFNFDE
jgi:PP-loop superfamily ATP-utilizing enzyme